MEEFLLNVYQEHKWKCSQCPDKNKYNPQTQLQHHEKNYCVNTRPHLCDLCGRSFDRRSQLEYHKRRIHFGEKPHSCQICSKSFFKQSDLRTHVNAHLGIAGSICEVCGRRFSHGSNLIRHMRIHSGVKPYVCATCGRRFIQLNSLNEHKASHVAGAVYKCCDKEFKNRSLFKKHVKSTHRTKEKHSRRHFYCKVCGDRFPYLNLLQKHEMNHKQFSCSSCKKEMKNLQDLKSHCCKKGKREDKDNKLITDDYNKQQLRAELEELYSETKTSDWIDSGSIDAHTECLELQSLSRNVLTFHLNPFIVSNPDCAINLDSTPPNLGTLQKSHSEPVPDDHYGLDNILNFGNSPSPDNLNGPEYSLCTPKESESEKIVLDTCSHLDISNIDEDFVDINSLMGILPSESITDAVSADDQNNEVMNENSTGCFNEFNSNAFSSSGVFDNIISNNINDSLDISSLIIRDSNNASKIGKCLTNKNLIELDTINCDLSILRDSGDTIGDINAIIRNECPKVIAFKGLINMIEQDNIQSEETAPERNLTLKSIIEELALNCNNNHSDDSCNKSRINFAEEKENANSSMKRAASKKFNCTICGKQFQKASNFKQHQGVHDIHQQLYKCDWCGCSFAWKSTLNRHMLSHMENTKPTGIFPCNLCEKFYTSTRILKAHLNRDHLKQRPHSCTVCHKSFFKKHDLKIHTRIHTKERPYKCGTCGKSFVHISHLIRHGKTHSVMSNIPDSNNQAHLQESVLHKQIIAELEKDVDTGIVDQQAFHHRFQQLLLHCQSQQSSDPLHYSIDIQLVDQ